MRAPAWLRDEVILACDLVRGNDWRGLRVGDPRVTELSDLLQTLPLVPPELRGAKFRNSNSVQRKTFDIATRHPDYTGKPTRGGDLDGEVLREFLNDSGGMTAVAAAIRAGARAGEFDDLDRDVPDENEEVSAREGRLLERRHLARERDPKLKRAKVVSWLTSNPRVWCEVCGFDFERTYGHRGREYIECHHVVPLHVSGETTTKLNDLILLCSNCHKMIHRRSPWLSPVELRETIAAASAVRASSTAGWTS